MRWNVNMSRFSTIASTNQAVLMKGDVRTVPIRSELAKGTIFNDVCIVPSYIEFTEAIEGVTYRQRITIRNVGSKSALVRIRQLNSIAFQVKALKTGIRLSPGLGITTYVIYTFKRPSLLRAIIPIEINGKTFDYRVVCTLITEGISIEPKSIDFDTIDVGCSCEPKIITIRNEGGKSTRFSIDLGKNDLDITVRPLRGIVRPRKDVKVRIDLIGMNEGVFCSEFWIKSVPNIRVPINVNIIVPRLIVHYADTTGDFALVDFPPTIENTSRYDTFVLRNLSSRSSSYVVLVELDNEIKSIRDIDCKRYPNHGAFDIRPIEGRMDPFQSIIFDVGFSPTVKLSQRRQKCGLKQLKESRTEQTRENRDFMAFIRIVRVHCRESKDIGNSAGNLIVRKFNIANENFPAQITVLINLSLPKKINFEFATNVIVKRISGRFRMYLIEWHPPNNNTIDGINLYSENVSTGIDPMRDSADDITSQRIYIQDAMTATSSASTSCASSIDSGAHDIIRLCLYGEAEAAQLHLEPDALYFGDLMVDHHSQRVIRVTNPSAVAPIYFECAPNAAARCYPAKMQLKPKASIEVLVKVRGKENVESSFKLFFNVMADSHDPNISRRRIERVKVGSYAVDCTVNIVLKSKKELSSRRNLKSTRTIKTDDDIVERLLRAPEWKRKDYLAVTDRFATACARGPLLGRSISTIKAAVLVPLSPLQIYNVRIHPATIAFGMVALKSFNYRRLSAENANGIPVMVRWTGLPSKCIHFPEGDLMILQPNAVMTRLVEYRAAQIGKFNGHIDYVINDHHTYELSVTADVVHEQLHIDKCEIELGKECSSQEAYRPMASVLRITNRFSARTSFKWEVPMASGFRIEPMSGTVRGNGALYGYLYYDPEGAKANYVQAMMKCKSGSCTSLRLKVARLVPRVELANDCADLGEIPLNLMTKTVAVLQNLAFDEVTYEVDSASLIRGLNINPLRGKISPRGIAILEVDLTLDVCCRFSTVITITIQGGPRLTFKINGNVSFPRLKILPQRIDMKRISADAFQTHRITATNIGTTILKLKFLMEEYPEFRVSLSATGKDVESMQDIIIAPDTSQSFYLHFQPVDLASYAFYLPTVVNELLGPVSTLNPTSIKPLEYLKSRQTHYTNVTGFVMTPLPDKLPTIFIDCTVVGRVIFFSKLLFRFNVITNELREELIVENRVTPRETLVSINIKDFAEVDCPFTIERSRGAEVRRAGERIECSLRPGDGVCFVLEFKPKKRGSFSVEAPVYVGAEADGNVFHQLRLHGEYPVSSLEIEPSEIRFMPVPLATGISEKFTIRAKYFDEVAFVRSNFRVPSRCSGDYNDELLAVGFPNGNTVTPCSHVELEATITFKSDRPVSFCLTIEFRDERALAICFLTVYATADDSLLTTYMYPVKSSVSNAPYVPAKRLDKLTSRPSISSDSEMDEDECEDAQRIARARESRELPESRFSVILLSDDRRSSYGKIMNSKSYLTRNEEINDNNNVTNNVNVQMGRTVGMNEERLPIRKRDSVSIGLYTRNNQTNESEKHLHRTITAVEEWMYSGPMKFHFYLNIPHGIAARFSNFCMRKASSTANAKKKNKTTIPSFFDVLESFAGSKIRDYLGEMLKQPLPRHDIERINYVLKLYDKTLDFLIAQGAHLAHVSGQFLLNYDDYVISVDIAQRNIPRGGTIETSARYERLSRQSFESRCKQCWLDVTLQMYKCFVLAGIHDSERLLPFTTTPRRSTAAYRESIVPFTSSLPGHHELCERAIRSIERSTGPRKSITDDTCPEEVFLLAWLQYHYERQLRTCDWMTDRRLILNPREKRDVIEYSAIRNFHGDLADCLALIAVTTVHCPFLIDEFFNDLYICPRNKEEALHNAVRLVTAWRKIRLGFIITPMQIVNPNCVQMLMLVVHLFQILPTYIPQTKIKFSCPLSQTIIKQITVSNPTDNAVNYVITLVNNTDRFFTVLKPVSVLCLNAQDTGQVHIQFHGKKILRKCNAYLLLCGRAVGPHFGRNQVIALEANVDSLKVANEYNICSKLYEIVNTTLKINVPYRNAAEYEIWMTEERPSHPSMLKMTRWCKLRTKKIPRRLFLNQKSLVVAEGASEAYLSISVACIAPKKRTFWLILQAKTGDFIIQINSTWRVSLSDRIVVEWTAKGECVCSNHQNDIKDTCPFNVSVPVPSRNVQLWKCIAEMFQKTLDSKERIFWSQYLDTDIGLRLIQHLIGDTTDPAALEFVHIFHTVATYKVGISDKLSPLVVPECFTIPDMKRPNEEVPMIIHVLPTTPQLYETTMTLTSLDNKEIRTYIIDCLRS